MHIKRPMKQRVRSVLLSQVFLHSSSLLHRVPASIDHGQCIWDSAKSWVSRVFMQSSCLLPSFSILIFISVSCQSLLRSRRDCAHPRHSVVFTDWTVLCMSGSHQISALRCYDPLVTSLSIPLCQLHLQDKAACERQLYPMLPIAPII